MTEPAGQEREAREGTASKSDDAPRRWRRPGRFLRDLNLVALLVLIGAGAALLLQPKTDDGLLGLPELEIGAVSPRTIKSPQLFTVPDPNTTEQLRNETVKKVFPTYDLHVALGLVVKERIEAAFAVLKHGAPPPGTEANAEVERDFMLQLGTALEPDVVQPLLRAPAYDEMRDAAIMVAQTVYENRIVENKSFLPIRAPNGFQLRWVARSGVSEREEAVFDTTSIVSLDQARAKVDEVVANELKRFPLESRRAVAVLVKKLLKPNLVPNEEETKLRKEAAERSVKPVVIQIRPGETVLRAGERVTKQHLSILRGIERELGAQSRVQSAVGSALLVILLVVLGYRFASRSYRPDKPTHRDLAFLAATYMLMLLFLWIGYKAVIYLAEELPMVSPLAFRYLAPVGLGALLVRLVAGSEAALAFAVLIGLTAGWMMDASLGFAAYALIGSFAAGVVTDGPRPGVGVFRVGLWLGSAQAMVVVALSLLGSGWAVAETGQEIIAAMASGLVAAVITALLLPVVEVLFGYTTRSKLGELADLNHPLLRELLVEAPGTYAHSIMVGTLAEAAAEAIGASGLLARAGGYYHDIGKLRSPGAFEENARAGLPTSLPLEEANELRSHVKHGLDRAAEHRLGPQLSEIIGQHHGTGLVRASYARAVQLHGVAQVDPADFSYAGPKPRAREVALVMLADFVETATRELAMESTVEASALEAIVRRVINDVLEDGQLDACDLSLREIGAVTHAFTAVLEERLVRRGRPPTLSQLPTSQGARIVRAPPGGEPN